MKLLSRCLYDLEMKAKPFLDKGHCVNKAIYVTFSGKYAVKLSNKPDPETIKLNKDMKDLINRLSHRDNKAKVE